MVEKSWLQAPGVQGLGRKQPRVRLLVTYLASWRNVSSIPDGPCATPARAGHLRSRRTALGSPVYSASVVDFRLCWPCGSRAWNKTSDDADSGNGAGTTLCNASTHTAETSTRAILDEQPIQKKTKARRHPVDGGRRRIGNKGRRLFSELFRTRRQRKKTNKTGNFTPRLSDQIFSADHKAPRPLTKPC